ncbi:Uncharacterized protein dnm_021430 [Desulfonema magnum]|uniref:Uncharacterized protein n=1 Tax=Desulfonema magnum TaxID=45655 RepID=A0A975BJA3_9BACT|nr:Uncharacterized protein dnm_021430 [Desulfonema magnum]
MPEFYQLSLSYKLETFLTLCYEGFMSALCSSGDAESASTVARFQINKK